MNAADLLHSYRRCELISRRQAGNFYPAFRLLPPAQRRAMCALYAFFRIADDLSDGPGEVAGKRQALARWREGLDRALRGKYSHPIHAALHHTVTAYAVPSEYLHATLDGVEMDLTTTAYRTFEELRRYCFNVASVVGLACIHVWGFTDVRARRYAESAGIAFQLTNILRDLREDAARGRVYLPVEDLRRFDYAAGSLTEGCCDDRFRGLMRFQVGRARAYFDESWPLLTVLRPAGRTVFLVMARTYRRLLDEIERRDYDVFRRRVEVSRWRKLLFLAGALPVRWGWVSP